MSRCPATALILGLFVIGSCSDEPANPGLVKSTVTGYVKYNVSKSPVFDVEVRLIEYVDRGGYFPVESWRRTTCTGADGRFAFQFYADTEREYTVGLTGFLINDEHVSPGKTDITLWADSSRVGDYRCK